MATRVAIFNNISHISEVTANVAYQGGDGRVGVQLMFLFLAAISYNLTYFFAEASHDRSAFMPFIIMWCET